MRSSHAGIGPHLSPTGYRTTGKALLFWSSDPTPDRSSVAWPPPLENEDLLLGGSREAPQVNTQSKAWCQDVVSTRCMGVSHGYLYLQLKGGVESSQFHEPCTIIHLFSHNRSLEGERHM